MRILVGMMHPKHVWMFKNFILEMRERGHEIEIVAIEKDLTVTLLEKFGLPFNLIGKNPASTSGKLFALPLWTYRTYKIAQRFKPDIFIGQALPHFAYISTLQRKPYIIFEDTESAKAVQAITFPFASTIVTPSCYSVDLGRKQIFFSGYFELAYLHPNYFSPKATVLEKIALNPDYPYIVVRFVSWDAIHDIWQYGIRDKIHFVRSLELYGRVLISSEGMLPKELISYQIRLSPEDLHDLLYYAQLYIGEGGTTASESAILGTPAILISSLSQKMGNFNELEKNYDLLYCFDTYNAALNKAIEILQDHSIKENWMKKREKLLSDKIDVTAFMVWFIENYPSSFKEMKEHPDVQYSWAHFAGDVP